MRFSLFLAAQILIASSNLFGDAVTYIVTQSGGQFAYDFTVSNTGDTGGTLFDLFLSIPVPIAEIDTTSIGTPVGWGDPTGGLLFFGPDTDPTTSFIEWTSDFSGFYDVDIGSSATGFSFLSFEVISQMQYSLNGSSVFNPVVLSAPEPSSTFPLFVCMTVLAISKTASRNIWQKRVVVTRSQE